MANQRNTERDEPQRTGGDEERIRSIADQDQDDEFDDQDAEEGDEEEDEE